MCPHCYGKKTFANTAQTIDQYDPPPNPGVFSEAVQFVTQFGTITLGTYLTLWLADYPYYWLAPAAGLVLSIILNLAKSALTHRPPQPQAPAKTILQVDITERPSKGHRKTIRDAFEGCRPSQLYKLADAHLNQNTPITRRPMARAGVSEGQFTLIRACLLAGGWAVLEGDHDTAPAVPNRQGRLILRDVLRELSNYAYPAPPQGYV